jgi:uncharacterized membrane protein YfbV (UPF0208 family)
MATQGRGKKPASKIGGSGGNFYIPPVPVDVVVVRKSVGEEVMGWIAACVLVALFLPLMGMLYLDNLTITARAEKAIEKLEKLERKLEQKEREKDE